MFKIKHLKLRRKTVYLNNGYYLRQFRCKKSTIWFGHKFIIRSVVLEWIINTKQFNIYGDSVNQDGNIVLINFNLNEVGPNFMF